MARIACGVVYHYGKNTMIEVSNELQEEVNFVSYLEEHEKQAHKNKLLHVSNYTADALKRLSGGVHIYGDPMPWNKTQDKFRFRPGEVTIWAGTNGSGKSLVMGQCALTLSQIVKVGMASFEMPPDSTVSRMLRQCAGGPNTTEQFAERFSNALKLYVYNHIGNLNTHTVYGMIHYMAVEKGIKHIMIDSLVKCGVNSEKNEPQKMFLNKIQDIAKEHKIHIHVVHHTRKTQHETDMPDKYSVKGAGELVDLTDNLILVYRNKLKEKKRKENQPFDEGEPDCYLDISKQRHGDFEGRFGFWWESNSTQWLDNPNGRKHIYVE